MQFTVENLGKVSKADIDLKPLTIFIGKNGSGKTYVASALWAYVSYIRSIENDVENFIPTEIYNKHHKKISNLLENWDLSQSSPSELTISENDVKEIIDCVNNKIHINKIFADCFKYDNFTDSKFHTKHKDINSITIKINLYNVCHTIYHEDEFGREYEEDIDIEYFDFEILDENKIFAKEHRIQFSTFDINEYCNRIISEIIEYFLLWKQSDKFLPLLYIPAARTGLMFGLHNFANSSLQRNAHFGISFRIPENNDLTAPLRSFIYQLHRRTLLHNLDNNINADFSEKIMKGVIKLSHQDKRFKYIPKSLNQELPLSASSSLVTETAVLSIFNSSIRKGSFVIFEEPEAHLHLSAQREMAKLIVKMINQGCHMLITTHSDTFLQQLNNLIMLNKLSENNPDILQEFNIEPDETIAGEKVAVYDFQYQDDDKTIAKPLELGDYGFIVPSINEEIIALSRETSRIADMIGGE